MNFENINAGPGAFQSIQVYPGAKFEPHFFSTSNYESYKNVNPKRERETCLWFLRHPTFQAWKQKKCDDILWLSADPGCGKSVLSRALIDEELVSVQPVTLCYFFFKDNPEQDNATKALCALVHKLLCELRNKETYDEIVQKHIQPAFKNYKDSLRTNFEELWRVFVSVATDPSVGDIVCILDALDECDVADRKRIIDSLNLLYCDARNRTERGSMLKFLVTSRPYREIEDRFFALTRKFPTIRLAGENESKNISREISIVMRSELDQIAESCGLKDDVKRFLVEEMEKIQNRTYLWLHLTLDGIRNSSGHSLKKMKKAVRVIPETVEEAYEKILGRCEKKEAKRVLHIILAAQRPLTLDEIDTALGICTDPAPRRLILADLDCEGENIGKMIRKVCGLFIVVEYKYVFLIHQTAREFLLRKSAEAIVPGTWKQSIDIRDAHRTLSDICVSYLSSPHVYKEKNQFLNYSSWNWSNHIRQACNGDMEWIQRTLKLCDIGDDEWNDQFRMFRKSLSSQLEPMHISEYKSISTVEYWAVLLELVVEMNRLLEDILDHHDQVNSNEDITRQATRILSTGEEITTHPHDWEIVNEQITDILWVAIENDRYNTMKLLLKRRETNAFITRDMVIEVVEKFDKDIVSLLLSQRPDIQITEEVLKAAADNWDYGDEVIETLLHNRRSDIQITADILKKVAENQDCGIEMMKIIFNSMGSDVQITEEVFKTVLNNPHIEDQDMKLFVDWWGAGIVFTTETMQLLIETGCVRTLKIVLKQRRTNFWITEEIVNLLSFNSWGQKMMKLILSRRRAVGIPLAAKTVELIVENFDTEVVEIIFNQDQTDLRVTEEVVQAAAANLAGGDMVMKVLLEYQGPDIQITEKILKTAAANCSYGHEVTKTLFEYQGSDIQITEDILKAAAANKGCGGGIIEVLLNYGAPGIQITEEVIRAAVGNVGTGHTVLKVLFEHKRSEIDITEEIFKAAAANAGCGHLVLEILIANMESHIPITDEVIRATRISYNFMSKNMEILLNQRALDIPFAAETVEFIFKWYDGNVARILLDRHGAGIRVTEEIVHAAATNWYNEERVMGVLLNFRQDEVFEALEKLSIKNPVSGAFRKRIGAYPRFQRVAGDGHFRVHFSSWRYQDYKR